MDWFLYDRDLCHEIVNNDSQVMSYVFKATTLFLIVYYRYVTLLPSRQLHAQS